LTKQLDWVVGGRIGTSVQLVGVKAPPVLSAVNDTMPVGGLFVPAVFVSVTVAVHFVGVLTATGFGSQLRVVEVVRRFTASPNVPLLPLWLRSPA
jgi:hypothetical protein